MAPAALEARVQALGVAPVDLDESMDIGPGRARRLRARGRSHSKSVLDGAFVWARGALNSQKRRFPARAVDPAAAKLALVLWLQAHTPPRFQQVHYLVGKPAKKALHANVAKLREVYVDGLKEVLMQHGFQRSATWEGA
jgi:hypothetical protein